MENGKMEKWQIEMRADIEARLAALEEANKRRRDEERRLSDAAYARLVAAKAAATA